MKTFSLKKEDVVRKWYLIDATHQTIGRMAEKIAIILMGKNKPDYTPHVDSGDFVIVTNIEKVTIGGRKEENKMYYKHSGYIGGLKKWSFSDLKERKPQEIIISAVKGMLPRNKLAAYRLKRLKTVKGNTHTHQAQQPVTITL